MKKKFEFSGINHSANRKDYYKDVPKQGTDEFAIYSLKTFGINLKRNTPTDLSLLANKTPKEIEDIYDKELKYQREFAKHKSGRYFRNRNKQFLENYAKAIENFADEEYKKLAREIRNLPVNSTLFYADMLPKMNDWYAYINKSYTKGGKIRKANLEDFNYIEDNLKYEIIEALEVIGK